MTEVKGPLAGKRIVVAGGGTAGHVNPMLATADELQARGAKVHVLGTEEGLENQLVPAAGLEMTTIPRTPIPRKPTLDWLTLPRRLANARKIARSVVSKADVVIGFGGYVSAPAYLAARKEDVPFVIHEQNVRPGLANRMGARHAAAVCLTFSKTQLRAKKGSTKVVGLPLRQEIAQLAKDRKDPALREKRREESAKALGLDPKLATLVVTGGSLGALNLNLAMEAAAGALPEGAQVLHLTGKGKADSLDVPWKTIEYLEEMELALAVADLVVCRSGAGTVAELAGLGLPSILVPLPIGNGEQRLNAADLLDAGAAIMIPDADFDGDKVASTVFPLLADLEKLEQMGSAAAAIATPEAAKRVADAAAEVMS